MKSLFKSLGKSTPAIAPPLVQPPLTDRDEKMKLVSKIRPIIQGIKNAEMEEMLKTAAEKNKDFNTVAPAEQSTGTPENESAGQAPAVEPGESSGLAPNSADPTVLNKQTHPSVESLFSQEDPMKEAYAALELESNGDRDSFFQIIRKKTESLSTPTDKESLNKFLELVLCLYIRLEGKVPPVKLDDCDLDKFTPELFEEGEVKDYPALLLRVLEKFQK